MGCAGGVREPIPAGKHSLSFPTSLPDSSSCSSWEQLVPGIPWEFCAPSVPALRSGSWSRALGTGSCGCCSQPCPAPGVTRGGWVTPARLGRGDEAWLELWGSLGMERFILELVLIISARNQHCGGDRGWQFLILSQNSMDESGILEQELGKEIWGGFSLPKRKSGTDPFLGAFPCSWECWVPGVGWEEQLNPLMMELCSAAPGNLLELSRCAFAPKAQMCSSYLPCIIWGPDVQPCCSQVQMFLHLETPGSGQIPKISFRNKLWLRE